MGVQVNQAVLDGRKAAKALQRGRERHLRAVGKMDPADWQRQNGADIEAVETIQAGLKASRRRRPLDVLLARKGLTGRQWAAGDRLSTDYCLGVEGGRESEEIVPGGGGAGGVVGYADERIDAITRFRQAMKAVDWRLAIWLLAVVCEDRTIADAATRFQENQTAAMALLAHGLDVLGDHYDLPGA